LCAGLGTVACILGLVWPSFKPKSGSKSKISCRILKSCFLGPFSSVELMARVTASVPQWAPEGRRIPHGIDPALWSSRTIIFGGHFLGTRRAPRVVLHPVSSKNNVAGRPGGPREAPGGRFGAPRGSQDSRNHRRGLGAEFGRRAAENLQKQSGCLSATYPMLRNSASGPEFGLPGRILAGLLQGKHRNRPSGRPAAGRRAHFSTFPIGVRQNPAGGPISVISLPIRSNFGASSAAL
jgi:hypothetical protein